MGKILIIKSDGTEIEEQAPNVHDGSNSAFSQHLRDIVGGWIEFVWVEYQEKRTCMIVNEEGLVIGLPFNKKATEIYYTWSAKKDEITIEQKMMKDYVKGNFNPIVGDVVLCIGMEIA